MHSKCFAIAAGLFAMALYFSGPPLQAVNVLTQHNDTSRTGANTNETLLTTSNVNTNSFGPIFTNNVDGQVYAQVLYVQGLNISSGTHNVIFVSTENNTVYAFDADTKATTYWTNHLGTSQTSGCPDTSPLVGITGTPVIDLTNGALYVDTRLSALSGGHELHALNLTNGSEMFGGPVTVSATAFGTGQHQRPGLLEVSNIIYVAYGSQCDSGTYHGFVLGYNATNLAHLYTFNDTPNGSQAAIWSSGMGPVADSSGNIYVMTANGTYDGSTNNDYGESMLKLSSTLTLLDWATPSNYGTLTTNDQDFGSGGAVLLPGGRIIGEGKDGIVRVANTSSMGHLNNWAQEFAGPNGGDVVGPSPVYWEGSGTNFIYYEHGNTSTYWYSYNGTTVNTTPLGSNSLTEDDRGGGISLSANGTTNGILWLISSDSTLRAYDAQHFPSNLWSGSLGGWQRQNCPTIANGKVYCPTPSSVIVFGLSNAPPIITAQPASQTNYIGLTATFTVGASGSVPLSYQWQVEANGSYVNLSSGGQFSGVTNTTLTISSLALTNATNYEVIVTNAYGSVTSAPAMLTVLNPTGPSINTQPASQTNYVGVTTIFTVGVSGTPPLSYQWQVESNGSYVNLSNGGQFSGVTNPTFSISSLALTNATNYDVVVTNSLGSVTSAVATLTVLTNSSSAYQAVVLADSPTSFWPLNETSGTLIHDIVGTNNGTAENTSGLTLGVPGVLYSNGVTSDTAIYFDSTNSGYIYVPYSSTLNTPHLSVEGWFKLPTLPVSGQPQNMQTMNFGDSTAHGWAWYIENLSGGYLAGWLASSTGAFTGNAVPLNENQWAYYVMTYDGTTFSTYCNGVLSLAKASTYNQVTSTLDPFYMGAYNNTGSGGTPTPSDFYQGDLEFVAVYNYALTVAQITNHYYYGTTYSTGPVTNPPSIVTQPASQTNYVGQTNTFTVSASGTAPLSYQWLVEANGSYVNLSAGGQFSGVTNTTLTISGLVATNATNYEVVVTNAVGSVTSAPATLTVLNPTGPSINTQPASQTNYVGQTSIFTVNVSGTAPLSYQWQVEANGVYANLSAGGQFSGVTSSTLSISSLALTNATNYDVVVTNAYGSITSAPAALTVLTNLPYQTVILGDAPVSYWPMQETVGPTIHDIVTTNAGPFNGTVQISTDGFADGASDGQGKNWGIIHETFTNSTSAVATDGATYLFGGPGALTGTSGDTAVYFTNLNGQLNNAQIAMGTGGTGAYEAQLDSSTFTAEAWINIPTYPIGWTSNAFQVPVGLNAYGNSGNTANGWWMGVKTDSSGSGAYGEMFFDAGTGTAFASNGPSAQVFSGKWVYAVQEYNGTATVIYTNGTLMVSNAQAYEPLSHSSTHELPFIIGSQTAYYFNGSTSSGNTRADFWDGGISHVAYYNYALPAGRISAHYQAGGAVIILPPPTPTLSIQPSGTNVSLSWTNGFLQQATNVTGPWTDVLPTNETSPQVIPATNRSQFFRASSQP